MTSAELAAKLRFRQRRLLPSATLARLTDERLIRNYIRCSQCGRPDPPMDVALALAKGCGDSEGWLEALDRWNREHHHNGAKATEVSSVDPWAEEKQRRLIAILQREREALQLEQEQLLKKQRRLQAELEQSEGYDKDKGTTNLC